MNLLRVHKLYMLHGVNAPAHVSLAVVVDLINECQDSARAAAFWQVRNA